MPAQTRNQHASRATRFSSFQLRNDALMIGPSGELVEAHAAGNAAPAIPEPVVGRIPADPGDTAHALPNQPKQPVIVTFTGTSAASESTAVPAVSVQAISVTISSSAAPSPSLAAFSTSMVASSASMPSSVTSVPVSVAPTSMAMLSSVISASASQTTNVPASSSVVYPVETSSSSTGSGHHGSSLSVAIVFAVLAGFALVISLVVWFTKIRAKSRRQELVERTAWPWDHNDRQIEDGYYTGSYYGQDEKSAPSIHSVLPLPPGLVGRDEIMHDSHHVPMPQSPYRLVSNELHQSVYDLAPEMGSLRVANYVPGDSRATSRLGMIAGQQSGSTEGPNTSLDDFGMLKHPWPSARNNSDNSTIPEEKKDPYYFSNDEYARQSGGMPDAKAPSDTWVSSLRSNIFNAFQVVVGGNTSTASQDDCYTAEPVKVNPASRQGAQAMSRQSSAQSQTAQSCYTSSAGRVIDLNNQSTWLSGASYQRHTSDPELNLPVPPLAVLKNRDRGTLSRASSVYSTASASRVEPPSTGFGLPHIPMSRSGSQSSLQQAFRGRDLDHAAAESSREQTVDRAGSIRNRAQSVMSSISKTASSHSEAWTDQEQFASSVLKERRKRSSDVHEATFEDNIQ